MSEPIPQLPIAMLDGMTDPFVCVDPDGRLLYLNRHAAELLRLSRDEVTGRCLWEFLPAPLAETMQAAMQHVLLTGEPTKIENIGPLTGRYFETMFTRVEGGVSLLSRDIHDQRLLAERSAEHEERLRLALEAAAIGTWDFDLPQRRLTISPRVCEMLGRDERELTAPGADLIALVHPEDRGAVQRSVEQAGSGNGTFRFECRVLLPQGDTRSLVACGRMQRDADGHFRRIIGTVADETEARRAREQLQAAMHRLQLAQRAARLGTFEFNFKTGENHWSAETELLYGLAPGSFERTSDAWLRRVHPDDRARVNAATDEALKTGEYHADYRALLPDGSTRFIRCLASVFFDEQHRPERMIGVNIDLTDRHRAEEALAKREAEFRSLFELAAVGAGHAELPSGRLLRVNARYCEITGYPEAELLQKTVAEITHPDDRLADQARRQQAIDSGTDQWTSEKRFVRKDGTLAWVIVNARVLRDAQGQPISIFGHLLDITDRKATEAALESARRELQKDATRLEATVAERTRELREKIGELETFSYSASHDLRSPLRALAGYAQVLQEEYGPRLDDTARHYLERLSKSADRLDLLVQDMLAYSRLAQERIVLEPLSPDEIVRDVIEQYGLSASGAIISVRTPLPRVIGHAAALSQSIANLLSNAVKFTAPGEVARIEVWGETRADGRVRLFIQDHGIGIAPRYHRQIFRLFERVHTSGFEGTGIGLAIVEKAVQRMKGTVGVTSEEGRGATFWIELPAA